MTRRARRALVFAAFAAPVLVALYARAIGAPPDQYAIFNKGDLTITDQKTNLTWQRYPSDAGRVDFASATCPSGFRLPTYKELLTLIDEDPHSEYDPDAGTSTLRYIDPNAFPGTPPAYFWSLSADTSSGGRKVVSFGTGPETNYLPEGEYAYVRCVQ